MKVYYGGEDDVTSDIARRLARHVLQNMDKKSYECESLGIRERGSAIKNKLPQIVHLGRTYPIVFVFDSDGDCVKQILETSCPDGWSGTFCALNIAIDEGESWLLADKRNFASYFGICETEIELPSDNTEVTFSYKTSLYIMRELIPKSKNREVIDHMSCTPRGKKPPTYNLLWKDYINKFWNVEEAAKHSESLRRAINRIERKIRTFSD